MDYEEFLDLFSLGGLDSFVISPVDGIMLNDDVSATIRRDRERELKMRIYYNDWRQKSKI